MANKPKIKKKERMVKKKSKLERKQQHFLKRKRRQVMSASNRTKAINVIRIHDTTHLAVTTTRQGNRRTRTTPHEERMRGLVKHRDYPPHSYIVNERHNSRNKRASRREKTMNGKKR